jgi:antitoxin ParD1/3/4
MNTYKLSISLPQQQYEFVEHYQAEHHYKTRSEVIKEALYLLQQTQLEACYRNATQEIDSDFETTASDGLEENETW